MCHWIYLIARVKTQSTLKLEIDSQANSSAMFSSAPTKQPRLVFKQLNGFQAIDKQGKIKTILFLNASREVVALIGKISFIFYSLYGFTHLNLNIFVFFSKLKKQIALLEVGLHDFIL